MDISASGMKSLSVTVMLLCLEQEFLVVLLLEMATIFGAMSFVVQYNRIGSGVNLGPGGILLTKPKNESTYIGNPAKLFKF